MKIKTIFLIVSATTFLQAMPLYLCLISEEFKIMLISDAFSIENVSSGLSIMFDQFAIVVSFIATGLIFLFIGATSFSDINTLKRLSFLFFVVMGFFALPDLISFIKGAPTAPLPVILLGLFSVGLLFYGSKKGVV